MHATSSFLFFIAGQRSTSLWHWKCTMKSPSSFAWPASSSSRRRRSRPRKSFSGIFKTSSDKTQDPSPRCVKSLLKFSLILKGDLLTCIAMVQCDLDTTVGLLCPHSQSLTSTYNGERKRATNIFNSHFCTGASAFRQDRQTVEPAEAATT